MPISKEHSANTLKLQTEGSLDDSDKDGVINMRDNCAMSDDGVEVDNDGCEMSYDKIKTVDIGIQFDTNSTVVKSKYNEKIAKIAALHKTFSDHVLLIEGHTDSTGTDKINIELSKNRATAVAKILINKFGVKKDDLLVVGFSSEKPISSNSTVSGRAKNRRMMAHFASKKRILKKSWNVWSMELGDKKSEVREYYRLLD
ncbi:MAG: OmpA family protein [Candidatus Endonucleobacter sp. (ex Gigantidas childressi)]|nr:OmpA family protein [Candidatus Endonucleobacter sp. (ex Gigantidas childressi)]